MRLIDDYLLGEVDQKTKIAAGGLLGGDARLVLYDDQAGVNQMTDNDKVLSYPVPFAVYTSNVGDDDNARLSARRLRRSTFISLTYVGIDRRQAVWAGERLRAKLERHRPIIGGVRAWPIALIVGGSQRIRRDDNVLRPDGSPLYYGIDDYDVSLMMSQTVGVTP